MKYFKTPSLKYFMKFLIFIIKWLKTFKNMIKVYEVSRKYTMLMMLFMHNNIYLPLTGLLYICCTSWDIGWPTQLVQLDTTEPQLRWGIIYDIPRNYSYVSLLQTTRNFLILWWFTCRRRMRSSSGSSENRQISASLVCKTVVTCKIKHLQKCFRAVDFPRLCRGRKNVVKMFYFTCNHILYVQHVLNMLKHLQNICKNVFVFYMYPPLKHFCKCFVNVLRWLHVK